jgi:hypothetical protein
MDKMFSSLYLKDVRHLVVDIRLDRNTTGAEGLFSQMASKIENAVKRMSNLRTFRYVLHYTTGRGLLLIFNQLGLWSLGFSRNINQSYTS